MRPTKVLCGNAKAQLNKRKYFAEKRKDCVRMQKIYLSFNLFTLTIWIKKTFTFHSVQTKCAKHLIQLGLKL